MKTIGVNTSVALQNAPRSGLVIRDMVYISAKDRGTGAPAYIGLWNGRVPTTISVVKPSDGSTVERLYQPLGQLAIPPIPASLETEVRTIRLKFSKLSEAMLNAIRLYDAKMAPIEIHRGIFDTETRRMVDPAICRFFGYINNAPITTPKTGGEGAIELECVSRSRILTRTSGKLFSDEVLKERGNDRFGQYLDVAADWRIWWGQEETVIATKKDRPKERFFRG